MMILAGDIGGTKSWLQAIDSEKQQPLAEAKYASAAFSSLATIVNQFKQEYQLPTHFDRAVFGLPGPVNQRQASLTNLPWFVDADRLQSECHIHQVNLINDFYAAALGVDALHQKDLVCLHAGEPDGSGHRLVVGAGTGLGVAPVVQSQGVFYPQASEAGHMDFAPQDALQVEIMQALWKIWPHLSYERLLSGPGIETLFAFLSGKYEQLAKPTVSAAEIHRLAIDGNPTAVQALNTFVEIYGGYIGNLILLWPARAGVYIAGGVAAKIEDWMRQPAFITAMHQKGRMQPWVEKTPIYLVKDESLGLKGALQMALRN
jgi:glucokinase